jgi:uncharacterized protein YndB with AHSA1/START domain
MATTSPVVQKTKANTVKKTFSRETSVSIEIKADPSIIWTLLTNASDFPRWNSTVISIEGNIAAGEKIKLKSTLDPKRTFKLKVKEFHPENKLIWGDAMGNRIYTLNNKTRLSARHIQEEINFQEGNDEAGQGNGFVLFSMTEKIGGPLFPLFAKMIPSFDKSFEQFATDLKKEAESIMNTK